MAVSIHAKSPTTQHFTRGGGQHPTQRVTKRARALVAKHPPTLSNLMSGNPLIYGCRQLRRGIDRLAATKIRRELELVEHKLCFPLATVDKPVTGFSKCIGVVRCRVHPRRYLEDAHEPIRLNTSWGSERVEVDDETLSTTILQDVFALWIVAQLT